MRTKSEDRVTRFGEVFTPPWLVREMVDLVGHSVFASPLGDAKMESRFLDPACGTGNFLVEVLRRKLKANNVDHASVASTLYGIDILADNVEKCRHRLCQEFDPKHRDSVRNIIAQNIIHGDSLSIDFDTRFDVIVGNPPYQRPDGGFRNSAVPIYTEFVRKAKAMQPRYLVMVIPARWLGNGRAMKAFRKEMLSDDHIRRLVLFDDSRNVFPEVDIAGGVCYFLWDRDHQGLCEVTNVIGNQRFTMLRRLDELPLFIRDNRAVPIVRKVLEKNEQRMSEQVSSRKPFGIRAFVKPHQDGDLILHWRGGQGPFPRHHVKANPHWIDKWKAITSYSSGDHANRPGSDDKRRVLSKIRVLPPGHICTETYLVIGAFDSEQEASNMAKYAETKFFRFLVSQVVYSHHIEKNNYMLVPVLDMHTQWSDEKLYERYNLTSEEKLLIQSTIRG